MTGLQLEFIRASEAEDIRQAAAKAEAEVEARKAAERIAEEEKKAAEARKRTTRVALAGLAAALIVAAAALWQFFDAVAAKKDALAERDKAFLAEARASKASQEAEVNAKQAKSSLADALVAKRLADEAKAEAEKNADRAKRNLRDAQITQSLFLADQARQQRALADAGSAVLLALEALPDDAAKVQRAYVPEAELQLDGAWRDLRERLILGNVTSAAFSPDGERIVTVSQDKTARIWDAMSGKPIGESLKGHDDVVRSAAFSADGKRIVTASDDKTARIWDAESGKGTVRAIYRALSGCVSFEA
jgi:hypothetical protein